MYAIAAQVRDWLAEGRDVRVAQVVATRGFSSRDHTAALAWADGAPPAGGLLDGVPIGSVDGEGLVEVIITDADATSAGLSCGGTASVLVQPATAYPRDLWDRLVAAEALCVTTTLVDGTATRTELFTPVSIRDAHPSGDEVGRIFGRGTSVTALVESEGSPGAAVAVAVAALWPVPTLVVVGDGVIATALADQVALLGWHARVTNAADEAVAAVVGLHRSDAYVVLSHDRAVDGPALAAALDGDVGYIGALGSRRTQAARRDWLVEHAVDEAVLDRIHGPVGLDIGARTPAEIAVSIAAEILAVRSAAVSG